MHYFFYMIRKPGTKFYYSSVWRSWVDIEKGQIWWHSFGIEKASQMFEELCKHRAPCEIVKFKVEELP